MDAAESSKVIFNIKGIGQIIFYTIIFLFIFAKPVSIFLETQDITLAAIELGKQFLTSTQNLQDTAKLIIESGNIYDFSRGILIGIKNILLIYIPLLVSLSLIFFYIRLFKTTIDKITSTSSTFFKYFIASIIFYIFQVLALLAFNINNIKDISDFTSYLKIPITCFVYFIKAIPILIYPIREPINKLAEIKQ